MSFLELDNVSFAFGPVGQAVPVLEGASLSVRENELVAVLGFSGSGKSTLMGLLAGLLRPTAGEVRLAGRTITAPGPELGLVFQNYSLLPWLTVYGNIELAVRQVMPRASRAQRREAVERLIGLVGLSAAAGKRPRELSGGMRQRVSLARTLALEPRVLLLDEPFSALDALTRATLQDEILRLWEHHRRTVVMVTNDVDEALLLADRVVTLTPGPRAAFGREFEIPFERPRCRTALNGEEGYKRLRNEILVVLTGASRKTREAQVRPVRPLPAVEPEELAVA